MLTVERFHVVYAPELSQYVVERGEMRIRPTLTPKYDPKGEYRAAELCVVLDRLYPELEN